MASRLEDEIRVRTDAFVAEITALVRASAMEVVSNALGGTGRLRRSSYGARGRSGTGTSPRRNGAKRDPKVLMALTEKLAVFIKKNPGLRIEQIGKALGAATKDLALPVKKLAAANEISTKGQKRSTTYYPT
jgi:hypothetical protein